MLSLKNISEQADVLRNSANQLVEPIDVEKIAKYKLTTVLYKELEDSVSGFLLIKGDQKTIVVNASHHENRQRFTIAHELGHLCLHAKDSKEELFMDKTRKYNRNISSSTGMNPQEIEANRFAAALLMPEGLLRLALEKEGSFLEDYAGDNDSLGQLAKQFSVSVQALSNRVSKLFLSM